ADEVELSPVQAVEATVLRGTNVLHVSRLTPPRSFYAGVESGKNLGCDFFIPAGSLSVARMPVVLGGGGGVSLVIPQGAKGFVELPGQPRMTMEEARAKAQPCAELSGAHQIALPGGAKARVEVGEFVFQVGAVNAG